MKPLTGNQKTSYGYQNIVWLGGGSDLQRLKMEDSISLGPKTLSGFHRIPVYSGPSVKKFYCTI